MEHQVRIVNQRRIAALIIAGLSLLLGLAIGGKAKNSSPASGTFYSLQLSNAPPFPFDPWPGLPHYPLGNGIFLVDDSSVEYQTSSSTSPPVPGSGGGGDTNALI